MESYIICRFNLFDLHQRVNLVDKKGEVTTVAISHLDNLGESIPEMCKKYNVNKVQLYGNDNFTQELIEKINTNAITKFNLNNIEIEVMENV